MSPLDQWRQLAETENAKMRAVCFDPLDNGLGGKSCEAVAKRREEIMRLRAEGVKIKDIARRLGMNINTVCTDIRKAQRK